MPSDRTIRTQLTNTYLSRAIETKDEIQGRFAKEESSTVVGAGAKYPASSGPFADATAKLALNGPEATNHDTLAAPVVGSLHEQAKAAQILSLRKELAQASFEQKMLDPSDPRVGELQITINDCMAELARL
jgi:hypothetical protein